MSYLTVTPAYGRDYKSAKAVREAWSSGKDFVVADVTHKDCGRYVNKQDVAKFQPGTKVMVRYARLTKIVQVP